MILQLCLYFDVEITILHLWIHGLTYILRIASHLRCGQLQYEETADIKGDCDKALREIQQVCSTFVGIKVILHYICIL